MIDIIDRHVLQKLINREGFYPYLGSNGEATDSKYTSFIEDILFLI